MCGQQIVYVATSLHLADVSKLIVSECRRARGLLYDGQLFGARRIAAIEPWRLLDDLDAEDYGGSWLTDKRNAEVLRDMYDVLHPADREEGRPSRALFYTKQARRLTTLGVYRGITVGFKL